MQAPINKPIFVVGSPRSGTSILTWCLGHHPNLFPVPESNWMGSFAVNVAIAHQVGAARGDHSILSAMEIRNDELFAAFGQSINDLILRHRKDLETKRETRSKELKIDGRWLEATSTLAGPKERWVDGTPEYSFYIYGLRKLFPDALFIHIIRDVRTVVRSMLNFHRVTGVQLAPNEQEAYSYWLRTVSACLEAERAYGPNVVHRIRYADLIDNAELAMRSLFAFLKEPYTAKCLEPLALRINSSEVPPDFKSDNPPTNPAIIEEACQLSNNIEKSPQPSASSSGAVAEMEAAFEKRAQYIATLDMDKSRLEVVVCSYQAEQSRLESAIAELQRQFDDLSDRLTQIPGTNR
ncbi:MAG TPA: sulfotransferase [Candidatus Udaeobacter sp.]|jgi:sulfotransferase family protein|nr:sulfotransferase [Candidatus Udaeobacter sp.]